MACFLSQDGTYGGSNLPPHRHVCALLPRLRDHMHRRGFNVTQFSKSLFPKAAFAAACLVGTALVSPTLAQDAGSALPPINVDASRLNGGIVGTSTATITAEDIARSPNQTIQDVLATIPGVQLTNLYGAVNGTGSVVDLRGFGAFASSNTLFLINGRRLNEADLQGVDLSTIPVQSIARIEVTRGNSGAVLYGDNAVGGVINIITKTGVGIGKPIAGRIEGGVGSYGQREGNGSFSTNSGPWSSAVFGNAVHSDGYRKNNKLDQQNGVGEIRYSTPEFSAFFNLSGDRQQLGFPGTRANMYTLDFFNFTNQLLDLRGTSTPNDYGKKQGVNATAGFTKSLWAGAELIVDGGVRNKKQQAGFFGDPNYVLSFPGDRFPYAYVDSDLTTWFITPRLSMKNTFGSVTSSILTGLDYYDARYSSNRQYTISDPPNHAYNLSQQTIAGYWQQTLGLLPSTDFSYGGRIQQLSLKARDKYDPTAPAGSLLAQATPLDKDETNHALHVGLEHRFNENFAVFGRAARAFRTPNVDERVVTGPAFGGAFPFPPIPQNFELKTQTSYDVEGGIRIHGGPLDIQTSYYDMHLKNEIHYNPVAFYNYNLDPTHRYGSETQASLRINEAFRLRGGFAYTRAVFEEGQFAGKDVPLVSRLSGSAGFTWNIWQKYAVLDASARFWSSRRLDNDQANTQGLIGANATIDLKLSGEIDRFFWSAAVINLFDAQYYDYGIASAFTPGSYAIYPLPGRMFLVKAGMTF
ncbi:MAG: TonB-dependent receptor [Afipia sp.]|jgi:iron complex outermembrane receptor protein|nr:MAG: TonB-dependent receptor [Afipia sp.]